MRVRARLLYALMVDMLIGILGAVFVVRVLVNWRVVLPPRALISVPIGAVLGFALYALKRPPNPTRDHPWLGNRQAPRGNVTHSAAGLRGPKLHGLHGLRKGALKGARVAARTDGSQGFDLDLPRPLLGDSEDLGDLAQRAVRAAVEAVAHL